MLLRDTAYLKIDILFLNWFCTVSEMRLKRVSNTFQTSIAHA